VLFAWVAPYENVMLEQHLHIVVAIGSLSLSPLWQMQCVEDCNAAASIWFKDIENPNAMIVSTGG